MLNYSKSSQSILTKYRFVLISEDNKIVSFFKKIFKDENCIFSHFKYDKKISKKEIFYKNIFQQKPHIVVISLQNNPDNFEVCRNIKKDELQINLPVIIIGAKGSNSKDIIKGLDNGAEDLFVRPINGKLMLARLKSILRRTMVSERVENTIVYKEVKIDNDAKKAYLNNELLNLTPKEFALLFYLISNKGKALSREYLLETIWELKWFGDHRRLNKHIETLRKKLGPAARYIETVEGVGYRFTD